MRGFFKDFFGKPVKVRLTKENNIKDVFISDKFKEEECEVDIDEKEVEEIERSGFKFVKC